MVRRRNEGEREGEGGEGSPSHMCSECMLVRTSPSCCVSLRPLSSFALGRTLSLSRHRSVAHRFSFSFYTHTHHSTNSIKTRMSGWGARRCLFDCQFFIETGATAEGGSIHFSRSNTNNYKKSTSNEAIQRKGGRRRKGMYKGCTFVREREREGQTAKKGLEVGEWGREGRGWGGRQALPSLWVAIPCCYPSPCSFHVCSCGPF